MRGNMRAVLCRNCFKLMFYAQVFVGEAKCKCGHVAEYHVITASFIKSVQNSDNISNKGVKQWQTLTHHI